MSDRHTDDRDALAALISQSGNPRLKDYERADAVLAAGWHRDQPDQQAHDWLDMDTETVQGSMCRHCHAIAPLGFRGGHCDQPDQQDRGLRERIEAWRDELYARDDFWTHDIAALDVTRRLNEMVHHRGTCDEARGGSNG